MKITKIEPTKGEVIYRFFLKSQEVLDVVKTRGGGFYINTYSFSSFKTTDWEEYVAILNRAIEMKTSLENGWEPVIE